MRRGVTVGALCAVGIKRGTVTSCLLRALFAYPCVFCAFWGAGRRLCDGTSRRALVTA